MRMARVRDSVYEKPSALPWALYTSRSHQPEFTLQSMMGLSGNDEAFCMHIRSMNNWATRYLSPRHLVQDQSPEQWCKFIRKLVLEIPNFGEYEDEWPARVYVQYWRRKILDRQRLGHAHSARFSARDKQQNTLQWEIVSHRSGTSGAQEKLQSTFSSSLSVKSPHASASANVYVPGGSSQHIPRSRQAVPTTSTNRRNDTVATSASAYSAAASSNAGNSIPSVRQFLRSLAQPLESLLPLLVDLGVREPADLRGLTRMISAEAWLHAKLVVTRKITELQLQHIVDGLDKLSGVIQEEHE
ncbi:hypothetical protein BV20DRAFT_1118095 [Pilatotrama ljubarskyi]|nr:hypothetical protein BV20DRAFT_1118095 [Pilatotrama ljubarskyi]